jgi:uncharacterized membrane protein YvlD (DUF360 family)
VPSPLRILVVLLLDTVALFLLAEVIPGFEIETWAGALGMAAVLGVLNALVWPVLARFTLPLSVLTLGLSALVLNGALVVLAALISPGVHIDGWVDGTLVVVGMTVVTALISSLLAIDDDESWYRNVVRRQARRRGDAVRSDVPGIVFIEIDGLAHDVLRRAMRTGYAPNLARWLADAHVLRTDGFEHCPDLVLNSTYWPEDDEVAAFEELVGSHGGMGGTQSHPFVLFPSDLPYPADAVVGPDELHKALRGWLAHVGQEAYAEETVATRPGAVARSPGSGP